MIYTWQERTSHLIGEDVLEKLSEKTVAVLGLGGVGGAAAEALCRTGIGNLILLDCDKVCGSNLNRQIFATTDTIGMHKCDAAFKRLHSVNPKCNFTLLKFRYDEDSQDALFDLNPDIVIDAIDTVTSKLSLAQACFEKGIPLLMCLGTGNRLDPSKFKIEKITETAGCGCGLAKVMRKELKKRSLDEQLVLYSTEVPEKINVGTENGRHPPSSSPFCPPVAGYLLAAKAVETLTAKIKNEKDELNK